MSIGNLSSVCSGRWTWESRGLRSVVDYFLMAGNVVLKRVPLPKNVAYDECTTHQHHYNLMPFLWTILD